MNARSKMIILNSDSRILINHREISNAKYKVIAGEDRKAKIKLEVAAAEARLADRRAKFQLYMRSYEKDAKLQSQMIAMSADAYDPNKDRIQRGALHRLRGYVSYWKNLKRVLVKLMLAKLKKYYLLALAKWTQRRVSSFKGSDEAACSVGGLLLDKVKSQREEIQALLRDTMAETVGIKQKLEMVGLHREQMAQMLRSSTFSSMEEGMDHARLGRTALRLLYEGDGMVRAAKFDVARSFYEAQLVIIRSRSVASDTLYGRNVMSHEDIKFLAFTHGRLGKLFFLQNRLDRSMVEFDRQLSLAMEINDDFEMADAYLGLGKAYSSRGDFDEAVRYLDTSQEKYHLTGCYHRRIVALRALQECFERKYEPDVAAGYAHQISEEDDKMKRKFVAMREMLTSMTDRLVHSSSADIEKAIDIERVSIYAFTVRTKIKDLEASIPFVEEDLAKKESILKAQSKLVDDIESELKAAYATEETTMRTNLLLDLADVVVDVEELKSRLEARKVTEQVKLTSCKSELQKSEATLANIHDEIKSLNSDLDIENCSLIQRSQKNRSFRCVAFDALETQFLGKTLVGSRRYDLLVYHTSI